MPKLPPEAGKIALLCASGIAASACPAVLPAIGVTVIRALAPNIASDVLINLRYREIRSHFKPVHPGDLNMHLANLLHDSSLRALDLLESLYKEKIDKDYSGRLARVGKEALKIASTRLQEIRKTLKSFAPDKKNADKFLGQLSEQEADPWMEVLPETPDKPLNNFIKEHLPGLLNTAFKDALTDPKNERAWKQLQFLLMQDSQAQLAGQGEVLLKIQEALESPEKVAGIFDKTLRQSLDTLLADTRDLKKGQQQILEEVRKQKGPVIPESGILTAIPRMNDKLIGREATLEKLHKALQQDDHAVCLVNGMGGIGKTSVAMEYMHRYGPAYPFRAWVTQTGDFAESLLQHPLLLKYLNIDPQGDTANNARLILGTLAGLGDSGLLVIDNAEKDVEYYRKDLPPNWKVLLTSREDLGFRNTIPLDFLAEADALALFFTHYEYDKDREAATRLIAELGYHTLTIELLAKTAQKLRIRTLEELIALFEEKGLKIGRKARVRTGHSAEQEIERLFPYLLRIFDLGDLAEDAEKARLLQVFALFPSLFTPFEVITDLLELQEVEEKDDLRDQLDQLVDSGWLLREDGEADDGYKMHKVIQEVVLEKLPVEAVAFSGLITGIKNLIEYSNIDTTHLLSEKLAWLPWAEQLVEYFKNCELDAMIALFDRLGYLKENLGEYQEAAALDEKALALCIQIHGEDHASVSTYQSNLGNVYRNLGDYEKARDLLEKALDSALRNFGELHPSVAISQSNLALVYGNLGEYEKARDLLEKALDSDLRSFGELHPSVAIRQSNLANVYGDLGDYEKARDLLESALDSALRNFGELHPKLAIRRNNLALVYHALQKYQSAAHEFTLALEIIGKSLGKDHPHFTIIEKSLHASIQEGAESGDAEMMKLKKEMGL
ncbi:MAG: ATP-binding protein [Bacteroidetes bacterium]|nr:ATP-binding protein [Bacteroidota bacterium]